MDAAQLATLKRFIDAVNERDVAGARPLVAPDVVLAPLMAHLREPAEPYHGIDELDHFFADLSNAPNPPTVVASEMLDAPTGVVVLATLRSRGEDGPVDHPVSLVFRLRNGRIAALQTYGSVATARTALGLEADEAGAGTATSAAEPG